MSRWRTWMCLSWMGLAAACGGDDEDEDTTLKGTAIDCSWFEGDNCYKQALATIESCTETGIGQFTADGAQCTYTTTRTNITFSPPVDLQGSLDQDWNFDMVTNLGQCMGYEDTGTRLRLETRSGTFVREQVGRGLQLTCPNGQQFHMVRALDALDCGLQNLPGHGVSRSGGITSFSLTGGPGGDFVRVFSCSAP
jgi:hypothetical protein